MNFPHATLKILQRALPLRFVTARWHVRPLFRTRLLIERAGRSGATTAAYGKLRNVRKKVNAATHDRIIESRTRHLQIVKLLCIVSVRHAVELGLMLY